MEGRNKKMELLGKRAHTKGAVSHGAAHHDWNDD